MPKHDTLVSEWGRFVVLPLHVLEHRDMTPAAIAVYVAIASHVDHSSGSSAFPSIARICALAHVSKPTALRAIALLIDCNFLARETRATDDGAQTSNLYRLLAPVRLPTERGVTKLDPPRKDLLPELEPEKKKKPPARDKRAHQALFEWIAQELLRLDLDNLPPSSRSRASARIGRIISELPRNTTPETLSAWAKWYDTLGIHRPTDGLKLHRSLVEYEEQKGSPSSTLERLVSLASSNQ
jgi:hypothetical protein